VCYVLVGTERATCTVGSPVGSSESVMCEFDEASTAKLGRSERKGFKGASMICKRYSKNNLRL
jgi:hypothetical protein